MVKKENSVHVQLGNPLYVRKQVLQTAIDAARVLKDYDSFKQFHEMKKVKIDKLSNLVKVIKERGVVIDRKSFPALPKEHHVKKTVMKGDGRKVTKEVKKDIGEINKLQDELNAIEERLKGL